MKYCPICERKYPDDVSDCEHDGVTLKTAAIAEDPLLGKTIRGKYRVLKKLGAGGMGAVYLAEQLSIGRKVALKVLQREFAMNDEFIKRFHQEARLAASLNHRHVITIHDFDQTDDGNLFIAMEYVEGQNLKSIIQQRPLKLARALRFAVQIAEGLSAAHRAGVIHRDIKPENIMILQVLEEVRLMDFGISRLRDTETLARLTRPGMIMGTPAYMAPEQIEGHEVDEKSDIYAFGVVLYEMLTGETPFKAPTPTALLMKHIKELPVPLRQLRADVPGGVEHLVMQTLEKQPERRQSAMEEIAIELRRIERAFKDEVPQTLIIPAPGQMRKRGLVLAGSIVLTVVVAGSLVMIGKRFYGEVPSSTSSVPIRSLLVRAHKTELEPGERVILRARAYYSDGSEREVDREIHWMSTNPSVAAIIANGEMQAGEPGESEINARLGDITAPGVKVSVTASQTLPLPARVVALMGYGYPRALHVNERKTLSITAKFSDGTERKLTEGVQWESSDPTVLNVNPEGEVEGLKDGTATLAARYKDFRSEPVSVEVSAKETKSRPTPRAKHSPRPEAPFGGMPFQPPSAQRLTEAPAAPFPPPRAEPSEEVVRPQALSAKEPVEVPTTPLPDTSKIISDYIRGERDRSKSRR
jgi:serine/threonine protein kinase